ncbi:MAG: undecaprenyl-diphosphate phosphatase [Myxococcales bacterium]|nr:undecaprenyl-diphosphate phosphatase [Myxococcales bacterium]
MDALSAALLGLLQGLTEFLPVSSSGHLVLGKALLGVHLDGGGAAFEVAVHFGTLLSVLVLLRKDVGALLAATGRALRSPGQITQQYREDASLRLVVAIVVGCLPAGIVGVLFKDELEAAFSSPRLVGGALLFTGLLLLSSRLVRTGDREITLGRGLLIGVAQAVAILPGVSRSGSTIASAELLGVAPERAARFSFLLSLPVIGGACALKLKDLLAAPPADDVITALTIGTVASFLSGLAALWLLFGVVRRGWFGHFGWYCLAVGALALAFG